MGLVPTLIKDRGYLRVGRSFWVPFGDDLLCNGDVLHHHCEREAVKEGGRSRHLRGFTFEAAIRGFGEEDASKRDSGRLHN